MGEEKRTEAMREVKRGEREVRGALGFGMRRK